MDQQLIDQLRLDLQSALKTGGALSVVAYLSEYLKHNIPPEVSAIVADELEAWLISEGKL